MQSIGFGSKSGSYADVYCIIEETFGFGHWIVSELLCFGRDGPLACVSSRGERDYGPRIEGRATGMGLLCLLPYQRTALSFWIKFLNFF